MSEWLYGDVNTPAFQLFTDEEICEEVMQQVLKMKKKLNR